MLRPRSLFGVVLSLFLIVLGATSAFAESADQKAAEKAAEPADPLANLEFRNIGPVNMSGRVADVEGVPGDPRVLWVGTASGGIWKTTDGGTTFEPVFDDQPVASIGDLAVSPSAPDVVWVGTGEGNPRNSVSFGKGVYRTTDGGASWSFLGLEKTRYITRLAVHPSDPDTAWVGALGSIFAPSEDRGVYRTTDGGATWKKVLYLDENHGVADLDIDPTNPKVLYAAMWRFERKPWTHRSGSEEGGVFRSTDGGETWKELTEGLPELMGRIGVKVAASNPNVVYVIAESNEGVLFRSDDRGETFRKVHDNVEIVSRGLYYTDLRVDPTDENRVFAVSSRLFRSIDGGKTFDRISASTHVDYHSLWIDPEDPRRIWQGQDGGIAFSWDGGDTWNAVRYLPIAQFYQVFHDDKKPFYRVGGGLQDNGTWIGPARTREPFGILPSDWDMFSFGDAYFVVPHPENENVFLSEYQGGGILRTDLESRQQVDVNPQQRRGDGGPVGDLEYRFNWNSPIIASPHDPNRVYFAGNVVFVTEDFGDTWTKISPDLTTDDPEKQGDAGGPVWFENTTAEWHTTIISFAESPAEAGVLWVGTDDGNLQLSKDAGETWSNLTANVGVPEHSPVSHVEPSLVDASIAYASFDRHMFDDFRPHLFKTTDFGATWQRVGEGIAEDAWIWVVREDPKNPDVVYVGTELGLYVSFDAGANFRQLHLGNLPTVSVHDVLVHPRENDLVVGTHGRAIWIFDDLAPIQNFQEAAKAETAHLFAVRPTVRYARRPSTYGIGDGVMTRPNPPYGALITYHLAESLEPVDADEPADSEAGSEDETGNQAETDEEPRLALEILDREGNVLREIEDLPLAAGIHRVAWNLAEAPPEARDPDEEIEGNEFRPAPRGPEVVPGVYTARLTVDGEVFETDVEVNVDPMIDVDDEALIAQHEMASKIVDLKSSVSRVLRGMDILRAELADRRESAKRLEVEVDGELETLWKRVDETLDEQLGELVRPEGEPFWSNGPRLDDHVDALFADVDSAFARPSAAQQEFYAELEAETAEAVESWNTFLAGDVAALDAALAAAGLPTLGVPAPVE